MGNNCEKIREGCKLQVSSYKIQDTSLQFSVYGELKTGSMNRTPTVEIATFPMVTRNGFTSPHPNPLPPRGEGIKIFGIDYLYFYFVI